MEDNNKEQQGLQLELPQDVAQGEYANFAIITHSSSDFIIDFARVLPGVPKAQVKSRVILAPEHSCATRMSLDRSAFPVNKLNPSSPLTSQKVRLDTLYCSETRYLSYTAPS